MFTVVCFSESQNLAGVEGNIAAVPDQHVRTEGDQIFILDFDKLMGVYACAGATAELVRLVSPSLRRVNPHIVRPLELAITPAGVPVVALDPAIMLPLAVNESLECLLTSTPGGLEQASVAVWLTDSGVQPVGGAISTIRFAVNLALVAGQWSFAQIDLFDELPVGNYKVVGGEMQVAGGVVFRFVPPGSYNRPGAPTVAGENFSPLRLFRNGRLGEWFSFHTTQPPGIEILSSANAVAADYIGYIDIVPA